MQKYVVSVGAGANQVPFIKRLKQRGFHVIGFDLDSNAPGAGLCTYFNNISTWDYDSAFSWISSLSIHISGVGSYSYGNALVTQQFLLDKFDLPGKVPSEISFLNSDKHQMKTRLQKLGLSPMDEFYLDEFSASFCLSEHKTYLVKPVLGGSSRDIRVVTLSEMSKLSKEVAPKSFLVQEYITGSEFRLAALIQQSEVQFVSLMSKENVKGTFLTGRLQPVYNIPSWATELLSSLIQNFKLVDCPIKIDLILENNRPAILEIDFGIPGDFFEEFFAPVNYGYSFTDNYIDLIIGNPVKRNEGHGACKGNKLDYIYLLAQEHCYLHVNKIQHSISETVGSCQIVSMKKNGTRINKAVSNLDFMLCILHDNNLSNECINHSINSKLKE